MPLGFLSNINYQNGDWMENIQSQSYIYTYMNLSDCFDFLILFYFVAIKKTNTQKEKTSYHFKPNKMLGYMAFLQPA